VHRISLRPAACAGKTIVETKGAPSALGPYNQAIKAGPTLYISGQIGLHPMTMEFTGETVEDQTTQVRSSLCNFLSERHLPAWRHFKA
jgi:enamine deaminase RidA (YjgF/YER057c/UK114 family)